MITAPMVAAVLPGYLRIVCILAVHISCKQSRCLQSIARIANYRSKPVSHHALATFLLYDPAMQTILRRANNRHRRCRRWPSRDGQGATRDDSKIRFSKTGTPPAKRIRGRRNDRIESMTAYAPYTYTFHTLAKPIFATQMKPSMKARCHSSRAGD